MCINRSAYFTLQPVMLYFPWGALNIKIHTGDLEISKNSPFFFLYLKISDMDFPVSRCICSPIMQQGALTMQVAADYTQEYK